MVDDARPSPESRPIRSYVLRQGRVSNAQKRAHDTLLPRYGIAYAPGLLDFAQVFGRAAPVILEIGFGMGETTAAIAAALPAQDFIGIEVHTPGVGSLLKEIEARGLSNLRVIQHDAVEVLRTMIPDAGLAGCHLYFPDPWPKKRHHKRRLMQPPFLSLLAAKLAPGAYFHAATDWKEYADWMLEVLRGDASLENTAVDFAPRPPWRPQTKFETRGLKLGHGVWDLVFKRRPR